MQSQIIFNMMNGSITILIRCELEYEKEKKFSDSVHEKFYKMSKHNLIIGGSESVAELNKSERCSGGFCSLTDEELKRL